MTLWAFGFEAIGVIEGSNFKLLWSAPLIFECNYVRFSLDTAHKYDNCHYNNCIVFQCFHTLARSVYGWLYNAQRALLMIASINWKSEVSTKKNEPKREKRDTAESIFVQKSGAALAVLPDRRRRPWNGSPFIVQTELYNALVWCNSMYDSSLDLWCVRCNKKSLDSWQPIIRARAQSRKATIFLRINIIALKFLDKKWVIGLQKIQFMAINDFGTCSYYILSNKQRMAILSICLETMLIR